MIADANVVADALVIFFFLRGSNTKFYALSLVRVEKTEKCFLLRTQKCFPENRNMLCMKTENRKMCSLERGKGMKPLPVRPGPPVT
jgi:hypothetical protein